MINFDQPAKSLEQQHETETNAVKSEFDQIAVAIQSNMPILSAAAKAVQSVSDQLAQVRKKEAAATPAPAETPTPAGSSNPSEGEI